MKTLIILTFIIFGCAQKREIQKGKSTSLLKKGIYNFRIQENSGEFALRKENGWKGRNTFISKRILRDPSNNKELEKSISFSKSGVLKNGVRILRPERSQYIVWFDKKKYSSTTRINQKTKSIEVNVSSPEPKWNGKKIIPFPTSKKVYCYFYQVIECVTNMGFLDKAPKLSSMMLDLYIVWEGYPFIQEQYSGIPNELFSKASISFDGKTDHGDYKYSLKFADQMIAYVVDRNFKNYRMFWVSQGYATTIDGFK